MIKGLGLSHYFFKFISNSAIIKIYEKNDVAYYSKSSIKNLMKKLDHPRGRAQRRPEKAMRARGLKSKQMFEALCK